MTNQTTLPFYSEEAVRAWLKGLIVTSGKTMTEWASEHNIDATSISRILAGTRPPNDAVLAILGLTRAQVYIQKRPGNGQ